MSIVFEFPTGRRLLPIERGERYFTKREVAAHLRLSVRTIERMQRDGLPFYRVRGNVNLYRKSEVDAFVSTLRG